MRNSLLTFPVFLPSLCTCTRPLALALAAWVVSGRSSPGSAGCCTGGSFALSSPPPVSARPGRIDRSIAMDRRGWRERFSGRSSCPVIGWVVKRWTPSSSGTRYVRVEGGVLYRRVCAVFLSAAAFACCCCVRRAIEVSLLFVPSRVIPSRAAGSNLDATHVHTMTPVMRAHSSATSRQQSIGRLCLWMCPRKLFSFFCMRVLDDSLRGRYPLFCFCSGCVVVPLCHHLARRKAYRPLHNSHRSIRPSFPPLLGSCAHDVRLHRPFFAVFFFFLSPPSEIRQEVQRYQASQGRRIDRWADSVSNLKSILTEGARTTRPLQLLSGVEAFVLGDRHAGGGGAQRADGYPCRYQPAPPRSPGGFRFSWLGWSGAGLGVWRRLLKPPFLSLG